MKKLGILFASVFLLGLVFQSCNNGKTLSLIHILFLHQMQEKMNNFREGKKMSK